MSDPVLALELVFQDVAARFAAEAPSVVCLFGWKEAAKQLPQGGKAQRVAFVPGVDAKGAGAYGGARFPGRNPRPLRTFYETCTVYCWAVDASDSATVNNQLAQWRAARLLHDAVIRAIELSLRSGAHANLSGSDPFSAPEWVIPDVERAFGAEIKFTFTVDCEIPDQLPNLGGGLPYPEGSGIIETDQASPSFDVELSKDINTTGEADPPALIPGDD